MPFDNCNPQIPHPSHCWCPDEAIAALKNKDAQLNKKIDDLNKDVHGNPLDPSVPSVDSKIQKLEECCEKNNNKNDEQDKQIKEINANISTVKWMQVRQEKKLSEMLIRVVRDDVHLSFQDWVQEVYIKTTQKFRLGDLYLNINPNIWAVNATYVCIRQEGATTPSSPKDWQKLLYTQPADIINIIGIDPIEIDHPDKHQWVISVDHEKLAKIISELKVLDLTKVELKIGDIYKTPVYKNDVTFELNVKVEGDTIMNNLTVQNDTHLHNTTTNTLQVNEIITQNPVFQHDVTIRESLDVDNHITSPFLTTTKIAKIKDLHVDGMIKIPVKDNSCAVYWGKLNEKDEYVSLNQTIFQPSFAKFVITSKTLKYGNKTKLDTGMHLDFNPDGDSNRSRLIALGGRMNGLTIMGQEFKGIIWDMVAMGFNTPDIIRIEDTGAIAILNSGIYEISYLYNISHSRNVWANRAGLALVKGSNVWPWTVTTGNLEVEDLVDCKWEGGNWQQAYGVETYVKTDHIYAQGGDYTTLQQVDKWSSHLGMSIMSWSASGSTLVEIPCGESMLIVPYIKPSFAGGNVDLYPERRTNAWVRLKDGLRDTGAFSQINIKKVANSLGWPIHP